MSASAKKGEDRNRLDGFERKIFKLVRKGATPEQWSEWLRVPLEHAAAKGKIDLFTRLMDAGADGSAGRRGCHGRTLLGAAAYGKNEEIVQALLEAGATNEVDVKFGERQEPALHVAAAHGAEGACTALMMAGANPNVLDGFDTTPLHRAAVAGHHGVVDILLLKGADPNARNKYDGRTCLHLAAAEGHAMCVSKLLIGGANKDLLDSSEYSPLTLAVGDNHLGAVKELLAAGANAEVRQGADGYSALDIAASFGYMDVVRALLEHGCSVKASDDRGYTALHVCLDDSDRDNSELIRVLLRAGADIDATTANDYCTPLHLAALGRSSNTVRALLEGGANANARRKAERTPLHDACFRSFSGAVELLLGWGADEKLADENGSTAEEMVGKWGRHGRLTNYTKQRDDDDQRIRHMLARAPADRSWRRRGWLVLARSCPAKVQLVTGVGSDGSDSGSGSFDDGVWTGTNVQRLVGRLVGLDAEDVFRLVVGFL